MSKKSESDRSRLAVLRKGIERTPIWNSPEVQEAFDYSWLHGDEIVVVVDFYIDASGIPLFKVVSRGEVGWVLKEKLRIL